MVKIFKIGSCRLNYLHFDSIKKIEYINSPYYTHTTKEVIQLLEFLNGKKNNSVFINSFPKNYEKIINNNKKLFKESDLVLIEISSIKELKDINGFYYNAVELGRNYKNHKIKINMPSEKELYNDLLKIKELIKKPVIFQGHINLNFKNIGFIKNRVIIDDILKRFDNSIILHEVFKNKNIKDVCIYKKNTNQKEIDVNHLTVFGYELLYNYLCNILI